MRPWVVSGKTRRDRRADGRGEPGSVTNLAVGRSNGVGGPEEASDAELLAATRREPDAFALLYRRYEARLLSYARARTRNPELAADLVAEAFAAALEHANDFDPLRGSVAGWLFAIAHNTLVTSMRRGRVAAEARVRLGMLGPLVLDDEAVERIERLDDIDSGVLELLAALPEEQRRAVTARVVDERDYDEIAAEMKCSPLVIRKRVSRGLATLRIRVEEKQ